MSDQHPARPAFDRTIALWLLTCCAMVGVMVVLGGLTRLTHSGLSMVEWQPLRVLPPLGGPDWEAAFAAYRQTPEFRLVHPELTLAGFKGIFWLEYVHRLWGRLIGLAVAVPAAVLAWRGSIHRRLARRLAAIVLLGGVQGLLGWLMVKSGLVDVPSVSPLRLAPHLLLGLGILAVLLWTALDLLPRRPPPAPGLFVPALGVVLAVLATATWGALVAGLGGGHVYNSFPLMEDRLLPAGVFTGASPLAAAVADPGGAQFVHRLLAAGTVLSASLLWLFGRRKGAGPLLPALALWAWGQGALGVTTLLLHAPTAFAAVHQANAVALLCLAVAVAHRVRPVIAGDLGLPIPDGPIAVPAGQGCGDPPQMATAIIGRRLPTVPPSPRPASPSGARRCAGIRKSRFRRDKGNRAGRRRSRSGWSCGRRGRRPG